MKRLNHWNRNSGSRINQIVRTINNCNCNNNSNYDNNNCYNNRLIHKSNNNNVDINRNSLNYLFRKKVKILWIDFSISDNNNKTRLFRLQEIVNH